MSCHVILEYRRPTGERVTITQHPGRLVVVDIDGENVEEAFVKPVAGQTIEAATFRFAREWRESDAAYAADTRDTA